MVNGSHHLFQLNTAIIKLMSFNVKDIYANIILNKENHDFLCFICVMLCCNVKADTANDIDNIILKTLKDSYDTENKSNDRNKYGKIELIDVEDLDYTYERAMELHKIGENGKAIELLLKTANIGHVESLYALYTILSSSPLESERKLGFDLLNLAAIRNHARAQYMLSSYYLSGKWWKKTKRSHLIY